VYDKNWDIVISNPPYISETDFNKSTSRSVRNWEPKLALVPPGYKMRYTNCSRQEDIFYPIILDTAHSSRAKVVLMEVSDTTQALRVAQIALDRGFWRSVEIWRDWPSHMDEDAGTIREVVVGEHVVTFKGSGQGRAVVCKI
jgi:methylase of polypeptide subunit release factors